MQRPWNVINTPIYSLATERHGVVNMNICTYVSAVSMKPKRYMVALHQQSQTFENLQISHRAVLQLLSVAHLPYVKMLGKKSGKTHDKKRYLEKHAMLQIWQGHTVLKDAAAYLQMKRLWDKVAGDHVMYLFEVEKFQSANGSVLMLDDLRKHKIISI